MIDVLMQRGITITSYVLLLIVQMLYCLSIPQEIRVRIIRISSTPLNASRPPTKSENKV